jgi:hypothetical protein
MCPEELAVTLQVNELTRQLINLDKQRQLVVAKLTLVQQKQTEMLSELYRGSLGFKPIAGIGNLLQLKKGQVAVQWCWLSTKDEYKNSQMRMVSITGLFQKTENGEWLVEVSTRSNSAAAAAGESKEFVPMTDLSVTNLDMFSAI